MTGYVGPIEKETQNNSYFRRVLFTGKHSQLVVMCLQPLEEIGDEVHPNVDQFFRIEQGEAKFVFNEKEVSLVRDGDAVVVPAGTYHDVINPSKMTQLKLYTIYSPPNHPDGTVHRTKEAADAAEARNIMLKASSAVQVRWVRAMRPHARLPQMCSGIVGGRHRWSNRRRGRSGRCQGSRRRPLPAWSVIH